MAQDLRDGSDGIGAVSAVDRDLRDHFVPLEGAPSFLCQNIDVKGDLRIIRGHIPAYVQRDHPADLPAAHFYGFLEIGLLDRPLKRMEGADDFCNAVLDDPDHFRLGPAPAAVVSVTALVQSALGDPDLYDVSVNGSARTSLRDEQVSVKSLDRDKTESPRVAVKFSCIDLFFFVFTHNLLK